MLEFQALGFLSGTARQFIRPQTVACNSTSYHISAIATSSITPSHVNGYISRNGSSSAAIVDEANPSDNLFARLSLVLEKLSRPRFAQPSLDIGCKPIHRTPIAYNNLMKAFSQAGNLDEVLRLAQEMKESDCKPNVYCYNTVMNALVEANRTSEAEALFKDMLSDGVAPNVSSYNILVKSYSFYLKDFDTGYKVITLMIENGCFPDLTTHSTLITGLCRAGRVEEARVYLYWMLKHNFLVDAHTFTPIVQAYCCERKIEEAKQLINGMERLGFFPNSVTYNVLVGALCKAGSFEEVDHVLKESFSKCWKPDEITFNAYMDGLCKHGRVKEAYEKWEMMIDNGIYPSKVTLNILLDCLCHELRFSEALCLLNRSSELEWFPGIVGYNTVMSRLCKDGRWPTVLKLFVDLLKKGIEHNTKTFNIAIDSLCKAGKVNQARCLVDCRGFAADITTYNTMIHWLFQMGRLNEAFQMFYCMHTKKKMTPDLITHTIMVHGLCRGKKYMEATGYFLESIEDDFALDVYVCLISKLLHHARYKEILYLFDELIIKNQILSSIVFQSTIITFCRNGYCHCTKIYVVCVVLEKMLSLFPSKVKR